jgi:hypothetical protein
MLLRQQPALRLIRGDGAGFAEDVADVEHTDRAWTLSGAPPEASRQAGLAPVADLLRATGALAAGDLAEAGHALDRLNAVAGDDAYLRGGFSTVAFLFLREQDRIEELLPLLDDLADRFPGQRTTLVCQAYCHLRAGDRDLARRLFARTAPGLGVLATQAGPGLTTGTEPGLDVISVSLLTEMAAELTDRSAVPGLRRWLEPYAGQLLVVTTGAGCLGAADRYLGVLDSLDGRDDAVRRFQAAIELEERAGLHLLAARTRCHLAEHLHARGQVRAAAEVLDGVRAEGRAPDVLRRMARLRTGSGVTSTVIPHGPDPDPQEATGSRPVPPARLA